MRITILIFLLGLTSLAMVRIGLETGWRALPRGQVDLWKAESLLRIAGSPFGGGVDRRHLQRLAEASPLESERRGWLRKVIDTDPRDADAWIALGLSQERDGSVGDAEKSLLAAARLSKDFDPAWTLANFYFRRQQQRDEFWRWLRIAAERAPDGYLPILQLADRRAEDPGEVMSWLAPVPEDSGAGPASPDQPDAQARLLWAYLDYLIGQQRFGDAAQVADRILEVQSSQLGYEPDSVAGQSARRVAELADRMIAAGLGDEASSLWTRLRPAEGRNLAFPPLDHGVYDFDAESSEVGFDWKFPKCSGVRVAWRPGEVVVRTDGTQPDNCVFLTRVVRVDPKCSYRVKLHEQVRPDAQRRTLRGLRVVLNDIDPRATSSPPVPLFQNGAALVGDPIRTSGGAFAELQFLYQRPAGEPRQAFRIQITRVDLEAL